MTSTTITPSKENLNINKYTTPIHDSNISNPYLSHNEGNKPLNQDMIDEIYNNIPEPFICHNPNRHYSNSIKSHALGSCDCKHILSDLTPVKLDLPEYTYLGLKQYLSCIDAENCNISDETYNSYFHTFVRVKRSNPSNSQVLEIDNLYYKAMARWKVLARSSHSMYVFAKQEQILRLSQIYKLTALHQDLIDGYYKLSTLTSMEDFLRVIQTTMEKIRIHSVPQDN